MIQDIEKVRNGLRFPPRIEFEVGRGGNFTAGEGRQYRRFLPRLSPFFVG